MYKLVKAAAAAAVGLPAVLIARTVAFKPKKETKPAPDEIKVNGERAVESLAEMIRCKTVSHYDFALDDAAEFDKFRNYLIDRYPRIHETCTLEHIGRCGLLYRWPGKSSSDPSVFMAHYDVVPADEDEWTHPAFEGIIEDGILWGRGTLDTKGTLVGIVEAAEQLIGEGFTPENDIYFAFSGEEEIAGSSALDIVKTFKERGIVPAMVQDEGGAVVRGAFPGVKEPCALIGTAEKGQLPVYMEMTSAGGHASAPPPRSILGKLSRAAAKIENRPFHMNITPPAAEMFDTLGRRSSFLFRMVFANLGFFRPVLDLLCRLSGGEINALVRTTSVITQAYGSEVNNVIPPKAGFGINLRLTGGDSSEYAIKRLEKIVGDPNIKFRHSDNFSEASAFSETGDAPGWLRIKKAVQQTWPEAVVSPFLMIGGSDSRHYSLISNHVYRFCPMAMTGEERATIHGNDEHIATDAVAKTVQFYVRIMRMC